MSRRVTRQMTNTATNRSALGASGAEHGEYAQAGRRLYRWNAIDRVASQRW